MNTSHLSNQRVIEKCRLLIVLVMNIFLPIPHIKSGYLLWYMLHEENTNKTPTIRPRYRIVQSMNSWLIMKHSKVPAQSDREQVDDLDNRDKAVILGDLKKKLIVPIPMQRKGYSGALRWALSRLGWPCWSSPSLSTAFPKTPSWPMVNDHPPALQDVRSAHIKADEHPGRGLVDPPGGQRLQDSHRLDRCRGGCPPFSRKLCKHPNLLQWSNAINIQHLLWLLTLI